MYNLTNIFGFISGKMNLSLGWKKCVQYAQYYTPSEGKKDAMKRFVLTALLSVACICSSPANAAEKGYGLFATVQERGSCHTESAVFGLAPTDYSWWAVYDPYTRVHISLDPVGDYSVFRLTGADPVFYADIWWEGPEGGEFDLQLNFLYGSNEFFTWDFPQTAPRLSIFPAGGQAAEEVSPVSVYEIPLTLDPIVFPGLGSCRLKVDFDPQTVPEPLGALSLISGLLIIGWGKRARH